MAITATRVSPGVYTVNGKTIKAATGDAALAIYNKQNPTINKPGTTPAPTPAAPAPSGQTTSNDTQSTGAPYVKVSSQPQITPNTSSPAGVINTQLQADQVSNATQNLSNNANQTDIANNNRTYSQDPTTGRTVIKDTASQPEQNILAGQQQNAQSALSHANSLLSNLPQGTLSGNALQDRQQVQSAMYNNATQDLERQYGLQKEQLNQQLANRGIPVGSDAYKNASDDFENRYQQYRQQAYNQAVQGSAGEQQTEMGIQSQGLQNALGQINQFQGMGQNAYQIGAPQFNQTVPIQYGQGAANIGNLLSASGQYSITDPAQAYAARTGANAQMLGAQTGQQSLGLANQLIKQTNSLANGSTSNTTGA